MRVLKAGRNRASHSLNAKYFSQTLRFQKLKIIGDWGKIQNKQLQADHNVFNPRSHIKFNSPMFIFHYIISLPIFLFLIFFVCAIKCASLYWGVLSFFLFQSSFWKHWKYIHRVTAIYIWHFFYKWYPFYRT